MRAGTIASLMIAIVLAGLAAYTATPTAPTGEGTVRAVEIQRAYWFANSTGTYVAVELVVHKPVYIEGVGWGLRGWEVVTVNEGYDIWGHGKTGLVTEKPTYTKIGKLLEPGRHVIVVPARTGAAHDPVYPVYRVGGDMKVVVNVPTDKDWTAFRSVSAPLDEVGMVTWFSRPVQVSGYVTIRATLGDAEARLEGVLPLNFTTDFVPNISSWAATVAEMLAGGEAWVQYYDEAGGGWVNATPEDIAKYGLTLIVDGGATLVVGTVKVRVGADTIYLPVEARVSGHAVVYVTGRQCCGGGLEVAVTDYVVKEPSYYLSLTPVTRLYEGKGVSASVGAGWSGVGVVYRVEGPWGDKAAVAAPLLNPVTLALGLG